MLATRSNRERVDGSARHVAAKVHLRGRMKLADKTVVVTGAGSGIGRATALAFAQQGAQIAACDVDQARLDALSAELGGRVLVVRKVDVADRAQMSAFADAVHAQVAAA